MKRIIVFISISLPILLFCFILAMRIWIGHDVKEHINSIIMILKAGPVMAEIILFFVNMKFIKRIGNFSTFIIQFFNIVCYDWGNTAL